MAVEISQTVLCMAVEISRTVPCMARKRNEKEICICRTQGATLCPYLPCQSHTQGFVVTLWGSCTLLRWFEMKWPIGVSAVMLREDMRLGLDPTRRGLMALAVGRAWIHLLHLLFWRHRQSFRATAAPSPWLRRPRMTCLLPAVGT